MKSKIVLASSSPYRKQILNKAGIRFSSFSPDIDESPIENESPGDLVSRLSILKAKSLQEKCPDSLIIGSDQVLYCNNRIYGKPHNHTVAVNQLKEVSGSVSTLYTGLALLNTASGRLQYDVDTYEVEYRKFSLEQIENYLQSEKPYDCCGSLKVEGPGICLIKNLTGTDPNTLIGLPLLRLIDMLENDGVKLL